MESDVINVIPVSAISVSNTQSKLTGHQHYRSVAWLYLTVSNSDQLSKLRTQFTHDVHDKSYILLLSPPHRASDRNKFR